MTPSSRVAPALGGRCVRSAPRRATIQSWRCDLGVTLFDEGSNEVIFSVNFWHWRAIVEAVRALNVIEDERAEALHNPFFSELTQDEARAVAAAIRKTLLPALEADDRLLLDGTRTKTPDDGTFHRAPEEQHKNYGTNAAVLEKFAKACETCAGFRVS